MQLLPLSLTALRVFDAAARHLSCSRAGEELFLTQSAVSKQIQSLEDHLGVALFKRVHHGLELTEAGQIYLSSITPALSMLAEATAKVRQLQSNETTLSLGMPPTFGQKWLIPRFAGFQAAHPGIQVRFMPRVPNDFNGSMLTAEIRFGRGNWQGMHAHYLLGRELYPVCSPALLRQRPVNTAADLLGHQLLDHVQLRDAWKCWFAANRVPGHDGRQAQEYEQFALMIEALIAGLGVGIMPRFLVEEELRRKKLVLVMKEALISAYGYYLVHPKDRKAGRPLEHFTEWILGQAAKTQV
jgi:LysR family transcriptional regulator, glycine cleavage system transcriptional activator